MKTYKEHLFDVCNETDLTKQEDVTATIAYLAREAVMYHDVSMKMDDKLKELMSVKDFEAWSRQLAKESFLQEVEMSPSDEFKAFVKENFDAIIGEAEKKED